MPFGQLVIGPPGSGKTTYCHGMAQYLAAVGRKVAVVNLDPANDGLPYKPAIDVSDLVHLEAVMDEMHLGPNGGLVYCVDYLQANLDWLQEQLKPFEKEDYYFIFDLPGQVELFMLHDNLKAIVDVMTNKWSYRLCAVHLVDAHLCTDASKYISALLLSLSTMLHLELPHVNVLSKLDLLKQYGKLDFRLDYYTEVQDLSYLARSMGDDAWSARHRKLSKALCEVVEDFSLVNFVPFSVMDKSSIQRVLAFVDKANGYVHASLARSCPVPPELVYGSAVGPDIQLRDAVDEYQEKYVEGPDIIKERPIEGLREMLAGRGPGLSNDADDDDDEGEDYEDDYDEDEDERGPASSSRGMGPGLGPSVPGASGPSGSGSGASGPAGSGSGAEPGSGLDSGQTGGCGPRPGSGLGPRPAGSKSGSSPSGLTGAGAGGS